MISEHPALFYGLLPAAGFVVGIFGSFTGLGGALILVPTLALLFGLPYHLAIGCNLASMIGMALVGLVHHYRLGHVQLGLAVNFMIGSIPGAFAGRKFLQVLHARYGEGGELRTALNLIFGALLVVSITTMIVRYVRSRKSPAAKKDRQPARVAGTAARRAVVFIAGAAAGLLAGLLSIGGGIVTVPVLSGLLGVPIPVAVGTSMFQMAPMALAGTAASLGTPDLDWTIIALLLAGSLPGAAVGPKLLNRMVARHERNEAKGEARADFP